MEVELYSFFNLGARWGGWLSRPGRFTPGKEIRYPLHRKLGGPQVRSGWARKISSPHQDSIAGPSSPYRLSYPGPARPTYQFCYTTTNYNTFITPKCTFYIKTSAPTELPCWWSSFFCFVSTQQMRNLDFSSLLISAKLC